VVNLDGSVTPKSTSSTSHYNVQAADWLAIGYRLTGDAKYLAMARTCFSISVRSAGSGTESYTQIHNANRAMHGNVYFRRFFRSCTF
jgi:hypothetical protein